MEEDTECRFQELFDDEGDDNILLQQEIPKEKCTYEKQLSMEIDELKLMYGCHPTSNTHLKNKQ